jgi:ferritin-like metal-binding protein YciE
MASLENLHDLFVNELRNLYDAEQQLIKALPLLAQAANAKELKHAFESHLRETKDHAKRLELIFKGLGIPPTGKTCKAMEGLVAEAKEMMNEDADPEVMDAGLIVAAQKAEHYEIAGYGSVSTFTRVLQYDDAARLLKATIAEEETADEKLSELASTINAHAEAADQAR